MTLNSIINKQKFLKIPNVAEKIQFRNKDQGNFQSTTTQQASYEDSLTLLGYLWIRVIWRTQFQKYYLLCNRDSEKGETERKLLFRRLVNCWTEKKERNSIVKIRERQIETDVDGKWAKYSMMKAPFIILQRFDQQERRGKKNFTFRCSQMESIYQNAQPELIRTATPNLIIARVIIHRRDQFSGRETVIWESQGNRKHSTQQKMIWMCIIMSCYTGARLTNQIPIIRTRTRTRFSQSNKIGLLISVSQEEEKTDQDQGKKSSRSSIESSQLRNMFSVLEKQQKQKLEQQQIIEERMSDQEAQQSWESRERMKKLRIDSQVGLLHQTILEVEIERASGHLVIEIALEPGLDER